METGEHVGNVPIPPDIYQWAEAFVIRHYVPPKKKGRKRVSAFNQEAEHGRWSRRQ